MNDWKVATPDEILKDTQDVIDRLFGTSLRIPKRVKIGRNEQCPCGSGIKYKKCCSK